MSLIVAWMFYLASFGPACWITSWASAGHNLLPGLDQPVLAAIPDGKYRQV